MTTAHDNEYWIFIPLGRGRHKYPKSGWTEEAAREHLQRHLDNQA